jgi:hypothetical protein
MVNRPRAKRLTTRKTRKKRSLTRTETWKQGSPEKKVSHFLSRSQPCLPCRQRTRKQDRQDRRQKGDGQPKHSDPSEPLPRNWTLASPGPLLCSWRSISKQPLCRIRCSTRQMGPLLSLCHALALRPDGGRKAGRACLSLKLLSC